MTPAQAKQLCIEAHKSQFRRDGITPYSEHPIAVAELLNTDGEQILGYLHDVIEDCKRYELSILPKMSSHEHTYTIWVDDTYEYKLQEDLGMDLDLLTRKPGQIYADYITGICKSKRATKVKIIDIFTNIPDATKTAKVRYFTALKQLLKAL